MYLFENGKVKELTNQNKVLFSRLLNAPIRKLLEERTDGLFLVQDFYPCSAKRTDPFIVKDKEDTFYFELTLSILDYERISIVGELVVWHKNGQKLLGCCIQSFMFHGLYEEWSDLGIKLRERNFSQGKLHGALKNWHENGQLSEEEHWKNGQVHGASKTYYREGQLASAQIMNNGVQQGVSRQWYKNGQIKCEEPYDNNKLNGNIKNWYETGQLKIQIAYKQGIKEGYCLEYYPNGQLKKKHYFKNNSETEIYEIYDKKGTLIKSSHNDSMIRLAPQMGFFEFPELVEHASRQLLEIINDQPYLVQDFYETGDKLTDPYYLLSKEEAYQTKVNLRRCFPSEATGLFKEYDRSGNLICQGSFLDGYRQGKWLVWQ